MTITAAPDTALESAISMIDRLVGYDTGILEVQSGPDR